MGKREVIVKDNVNYPDICWKPYVAKSKVSDIFVICLSGNLISQIAATVTSSKTSPRNLERKALLCYPVPSSDQSLECHYMQGTVYSFTIKINYVWFMLSRSPQLELSDMNITRKYCTINAIMDIVTNCYKKHREKESVFFFFCIISKKGKNELSETSALDAKKAHFPINVKGMVYEALKPVFVREILRKERNQ